MKKILVIDDDRSVRELLMGLLQEQGFHTAGAENGRVGVELARAYLPDLILCDVVMPQLDGHGVLTELRQHSETATIPFIFLTARIDHTDIRQGMELGADDYLTKPCTATELLKAICSRFEKHEALLHQSQRQLDDLRSSIAMSLPHELRTPLNSVMGLAEMLMEDYMQVEPQEVFEIAEGIYRSAERLYGLIQNFLLYAELELILRDTAHIQALRGNETLSPKHLITSVATQVAKQAGREADLHLNLQNAPIGMSDLHLKKLIEELLKNGFKFSKAGTPVSVTGIASDKGLTLYIIDRGRGMTPEQIASLGAYMQFDRKLHEQQGSGLGLVIAKRLLEVYGGALEIESVLDQQTIVQVILPGSTGGALAL